eukprot:4372060-Prymnesium_polylepis.1
MYAVPEGSAGDVRGFDADPTIEDGAYLAYIERRASDTIGFDYKDIVRPPRTRIPLGQNL